LETLRSKPPTDRQKFFKNKDKESLNTTLSKMIPGLRKPKFLHTGREARNTPVKVEPALMPVMNSLETMDPKRKDN
jgi:hypothetical protein